MSILVQKRAILLNYYGRIGISIIGDTDQWRIGDTDTRYLERFFGNPDTIQKYRYRHACTCI